MRLRLWGIVALAAATAAASAHDIWIEPSSDLIRITDWVRLSLMLGNHGNGHRDFRLANKVKAGAQSLAIYDPKGIKHDITPTLFDAGMTPGEGFWTCKYTPPSSGLYMAVSTFDQVMSYAPVRDVKCAKTFFAVSDFLDRVPTEDHGFDRTIGAPLELALLTEPGVGLGVGKPIKVRLTFQGKPMKGAVVNFVPKGAKAKGDLDPLYQKKTAADGTATMTIREANTYLISAHYEDEKAKGKGYESINYSATICLLTH